MQSNWQPSIYISGFGSLSGSISAASSSTVGDGGSPENICCFKWARRLVKGRPDHDC